MPSRRKITLPDHVRKAVLDEIAMDYQAIQAATDRMHRRVYLGLMQGLIQDDVADRLNSLEGVKVTRQAVSLWKQRGEQLSEQQAGTIGLDGSPGRPGEREPVG